MFSSLGSFAQLEYFCIHFDLCSGENNEKKRSTGFSVVERNRRRVFLESHQANVNAARKTAAVCTGRCSDTGNRGVGGFTSRSYSLRFPFKSKSGREKPRGCSLKINSGTQCK